MNPEVCLPILLALGTSRQSEEILISLNSAKRQESMSYITNSDSDVYSDEIESDEQLPLAPEARVRMFFGTDIKNVKKDLQGLKDEVGELTTNFVDVINTVSSITHNISDIYSFIQIDNNEITKNYTSLLCNMSTVSQKFDVITEMSKIHFQQINVTNAHIKSISPILDKILLRLDDQEILIRTKFLRLDKKISQTVLGIIDETITIQDDIKNNLWNFNNRLRSFERSLENCTYWTSCTSLASGQKLSDSTIFSEKQLPVSLSLNTSLIGDNLQMQGSQKIVTVDGINKLSQSSSSGGMVGSLGGFVIFSNMPVSLSGNITNYAPQFSGVFGPPVDTPNVDCNTVTVLPNGSTLLICDKPIVNTIATTTKILSSSPNFNQTNQLSYVNGITTESPKYSSTVSVSEFSTFYTPDNSPVSTAYSSSNNPINTIPTLFSTLGTFISEVYPLSTTTTPLTTTICLQPTQSTLVLSTPPPRPIVPKIQLSGTEFIGQCVCICACLCQCPVVSLLDHQRTLSNTRPRRPIAELNLTYGIDELAYCNCLCPCPCESDVYNTTSKVLQTTPFFTTTTVTSTLSIFNESESIDPDFVLTTTLEPDTNKCIADLCVKMDRIEKNMYAQHRVTLDIIAAMQTTLQGLIISQIDEVKNWISETHHTNVVLHREIKNISTNFNFEIMRKFSETLNYLYNIQRIINHVEANTDTLVQQTIKQEPFNDNYLYYDESKPTNVDNYFQDFYSDEFKSPIAKEIGKEHDDPVDTVNYDNHDYNSNENNILEETFQPFEFIDKNKYPGLFSEHIDQHSNKNYHEPQVRKKYRLQKPPLRTRISTSSYMRQLMPNLNPYITQWRVPTIIRRPNKNILTPIKVHPYQTKQIFNKLPPLPPKIIVAAKKGKPYSFSYSDGRGTNFNVNVNRRNRDYHANDVQYDASIGSEENSDENTSFENDNNSYSYINEILKII